MTQRDGFWVDLTRKVKTSTLLARFGAHILTPALAAWDAQKTELAVARHSSEPRRRAQSTLPLQPSVPPATPQISRRASQPEDHGEEEDEYVGDNGEGSEGSDDEVHAPSSEDEEIVVVSHGQRQHTGGSPAAMYQADSMITEPAAEPVKGQYSCFYIAKYNG